MIRFIRKTFFSIHADAPPTARLAATTAAMSLNCLSCGGYESPSPKRKATSEQDGMSWTARCCGVDRSWSGNLTPPPPPLAYGKLRSGSAKYSSHGGGEARDKGQHRRMWSTGSALLEEEMSEAKPRLVRSRGMRREWSFEDVGKCNSTNCLTSAANIPAQF